MRRFAIFTAGAALVLGSLAIPGMAVANGRTASPEKSTTISAQGVTLDTQFTAQGKGHGKSGHGKSYRRGYRHGYSDSRHGYYRHGHDAAAAAATAATGRGAVVTAMAAATAVRATTAADTGAADTGAAATAAVTTTPAVSRTSTTARTTAARTASPPRTRTASTTLAATATTTRRSVHRAGKPSRLPTRAARSVVRTDGRVGRQVGPREAAGRPRRFLLSRQVTAPASRSLAISPSETPQSARASSVSAAGADGGREIAPGVRLNRGDGAGWTTPSTSTNVPRATL